MDSHILIAKRYAQAFLNIFTIAIGDLAKLHKAISFLEHHKEIFSLLKVPLLDARIKSQSLDEYVVSKFELPDSFKTLIGLLVKHKRSFLIIDVLKELMIVFQDRQGIETFVISSSTQLDQTQMKKIYAFLADKTHHMIVCESRIDAQLIGGIRMQSADHLWEYSIAKQLRALQNAQMQ